MKRQRTRQTDTREVHVHTDWTAMKRETFSGVLKSSHPDTSDTSDTIPPTPQTRDFSILQWPRDVRVRLACALIKKENTPLLVNR